MTTDRVLRVLIIDDNNDMASDARREIEESFTDDSITVQVQIANDFDEGYRLVSQGACDLVVLDVRRDASGGRPEDQAAGRHVYSDIRKARFVPVVFWTALPEHVAGEEMLPLVAVLAKEDLERLPDTIRAAVDSRAVSVMAEIERHVDDVLRDHMWKELAPHWAEYTDGGESSGIARVLISRLARVLDADREQHFTSHPSHRYLYPPAVEAHGPGDVLREKSDSSWWIVLTPACDFEQNKAERVVLAHAGHLSETKKYKAWRSNTDNSNKWNDLRQNILMATQNRYHYLPAFREIPDLVVDLQYLRSIELDEIGNFDAVASLASPFAEALLVQHSHYAGRIGVPDLDADYVKTRLLAEATVGPEGAQSESS